jgi:flagellar hook protein FlgE
MGIFGALTTAVTGMRAQSYALENISGNIANSQTTAFKRMDTSFVDLIPDAVPSKQTAGNIVANSRATNAVQGDIQNASIGTFMAINGDGFFVVQKPGSFQDNRPVFDGIDLYTRRGDFQPDKSGYLVNGAGYYLLGIPVDPMTGNLVGSVPELLQFQSDFLPAQATSSIDYRANVASYPLTPSHDKDVPGSELLQQANYQGNPIAGPLQPARVLGSGANLLPDAFAVRTGTNDLTALASAGGNLVINGQTVVVNAGDDGTDIMNAINANLALAPLMTASLTGGGELRITGDTYDQAISIDAGTTAALLTEIGTSVGTSNPTNLMTQAAVQAGQTLTVQVSGSAMLTVTFGTGANTGSLSELTTALSALLGGTTSVDPTGNITVTAGNTTSTISIGGTANPLNFGMQVTTAYPGDGTVRAIDLDTFINESIGGGAITAYDIAGSPVNVQLRWAKIDSALYPPGTDKWNLFYQESSSATGVQVAWRNVGIDYTFGPNGQMSPLVNTVTLNNVTVDGVALGTVIIKHGSGGITQFADPNGSVQVNLLQQNGFPAGELQQVAVNDKGRVVGSYSNGRTIDLAEITLANFNGVNGLRRIDGGAFSATDESGVATYGAPGRIVNSSLEGSNTDIADEFTKLIITQQAYSANTRVITTSNSMVQDLLNMLR